MGGHEGESAPFRLGRVGFGTVAVGGLHAAMTESSARELFETAWALGVDFVDTAPWYGRGLAEARLGGALREAPDGRHVVITKVGRYLAGSRDAPDTAPWTGGLDFPVVFDYSRSGILRSFEQSQQRLGLSKVDLLFVHDLDVGYHGADFEAHFRQLADTGISALIELREAGFVDAIGVAVNDRELIPRFLAAFEMDYMLVAGPLTLLEHDILREEMVVIRERGVRVVAASVLQSGILSGSRGSARARTRFKYERAPGEVVTRVARIEQVCRDHDTDLLTAALNFPLIDPNVTSVVVGASTPGQLKEGVSTLEKGVPTDLWLDLRAQGLIGEFVRLPHDR